MKLKKAARILSAVLMAAALLACGALASGQVIYDTDEPVSPWLEALAEEHLVDGQYPVNSRGQTYGPQSLVRVTGRLPDLISAIGVDGVEGYILRTDTDPEITTREGALLHTAIANQNLTIPLYDEECNVIGTVELSPVPQEAVDNAVAALNEMGEDAYQTALADLYLVDGQYPVNSKGQTYGPQGLIKTMGYAPDLISAVGEDGVEGYILREDVEGPEVNTPEEALESMLTANDRLIIPLFDVEGNEIGTFHITPIPEEHVAAAREALARMRGE